MGSSFICLHVQPSSDSASKRPVATATSRRHSPQLSPWPHLWPGSRCPSFGWPNGPFLGAGEPHCHAATPLTKVHGTFRTSLRHHCTLKCCLMTAKGCCWWITMKSLIGCIQRLDGTLATFAISCGMRRLSCGAVQFFSCSILVAFSSTAHSHLHTLTVWQASNTVFLRCCCRTQACWEQQPFLPCLWDRA